MSSEEQANVEETPEQKEEVEENSVANQEPVKGEKPVAMFESLRITCKLKGVSNQDAIKQQSVEIEGEERARRCPDVEEGTIIGYYDEDAKTVHEIFTRGVKIAGAKPCLGWRPSADAAYTWLSYEQVLEQAQWIGSGIIAKGESACQEQLVGIYANNRVEWSVVDKACAGFSMVSVPLYDTLGETAMIFIVKQCALANLFCDSNKKAAMLLNAQKKGDIDSLKLVVLMEPPNEDVKAISGELGVEVITYEQLKQIGQENVKEFVPPCMNDLYTICYTSGTTGNPKGVMLTHSNMSANVSAAMRYIVGRSHVVTPEDILLSYLPLAHILERELELCCHAEGARIGFFAGNIRKVTDDAIALKPTIFPLVPRMMNKIYDKVWASANSSFIKRTLMNFAVNRKLSQLSRGRVSSNTIWDKLVFSKVQALLGGNVRISLTGAAPISVEVLNFMRCALGVPLNEAYGATETSAGTSATVPGDYEGGNVGSILPTNLVKLVDVEEKNYFAKDNKGEICIKGTNLFKGYYKDEENTKKSIDENGWFHSGDIGTWLPNGALKIIDRKKNIFKLSQGEYIAPEKIEQMCVLSAPVAQCFIHGHSLKSTLIGLIVADEDVLATWCKGKGFNEKLEFKDLCKNENVNALILADVEQVARGGGLKSFEIPKKIVVTSDAFTVENDMLTPSMKNRRIQIFEAYEKELNEVYEGME